MFLLYSLGVLGVGSFVYLPVNSDPPNLDVLPMAMLTGAIEPAVVVSATNSLALIGLFEWHEHAHILYHLPFPDQCPHADYEL